MKVILVEDVEDLGRAGEILNVKDGYGRNYLIPRKKALPATPQNIQKMEKMKKEMEAARSKARSDAEKLSERIRSLSVTLSRKAGEGEKLFGSVTSLDIQRALKEQGIEVDRKKILLQEPIKSLGVFHVPVRLHPEVTTEVKVWVIQE
ncbi:MAG: 50S ribosomal protein L9 [Thermodesulfobacteriota bacterium]